MKRLILALFLLSACSKYPANPPQEEQEPDCLIIYDDHGKAIDLDCDWQSGCVEGCLDSTKTP